MLLFISDTNLNEEFEGDTNGRNKVPEILLESK